MLCLYNSKSTASWTHNHHTTITKHPLSTRPVPSPPWTLSHLFSHSDPIRKGFYEFLYFLDEETNLEVYVFKKLTNAMVVSDSLFFKKKNNTNHQFNTLKRILPGGYYCYYQKYKKGNPIHCPYSEHLCTKLWNTRRSRWSDAGGTQTTESKIVWYMP